jgi:hypothetical protein
MRCRCAIRFSTLAASCILATGAGCTHHHYYSVAPGTVAVPGDPCAPAQPGTVISSARPVVTTPAVGAVCDDPPQGSVAVRSTPMISNAGPIANMPIRSRPLGRPLRRGGLAWRNSNTESLATTRIEGAYDDESTFK